LFGQRLFTFDVRRRRRFANNAHDKSFERRIFKNPANCVFQKITSRDLAQVKFSTQQKAMAIFVERRD
jgi:hypothetical protein